MRTLVFCLEEPSAQAMLEGLLPRMLGDDVEICYLVFRGKQDLDKQLVKRLRGWLRPNTDFLVLRDQDYGDCHDTKRKLLRLCQQAGRTNTLVRIACRQLESFYLGDLCAVEKGLGISGLHQKQNSRKFRNPDVLGAAVDELKRLTKGQYQKVSGSRAIGKHLALGANRSRSFRVLVQGIRDVVEKRK